MVSPSKCLAFLSASLVFAAGSSASSPDPLLWGSLKPGRYAVGYRSLFQLDYARQYDPDYAASSKAALKPRPILVDIWYPAKKTSAPPMEYAKYLEVRSDDARVASFARRLSYNFREVVGEETVGKVPEKMDAREAAAFRRLLATKTFAVKDAPTAEGHFPVVVYHPGSNGTPEDNSALFEYLASHGYVVISSIYQDADGYDVHCGGGGLPCSFRDMEFLCRYARELKFADADQIAAMGHSYGAWAIFAWAAEPGCSIKAFVSLDSGLEYDTVETSGAESLQHQMKLNKDTIRATSFRAASRERDANFENIDSYLKFAPRYEATASGLTHNDFLTHGAIRPALMPQKWPESNGLRRRSYDRICNHILYFLDVSLKRQTDARKALERSAQGEGLDAGFTLRFKPATPPPPSERQLSEYVVHHGVESAIAFLRSVGRDSNYLVGAAHILLQDGDVKTSLVILRKLNVDKPNLVGVQALFGQALLLTGDRKGALAAFRKGQEILAASKTSSIWKYYIDQGLKELGETAP